MRKEIFGDKDESPNDLFELIYKEYSKSYQKEKLNEFAIGYGLITTMTFFKHDYPIYFKRLEEIYNDQKKLWGVCRKSNE